MNDKAFYKIIRYMDALNTMQEQRNLYHSLEKYPSVFRVIKNLIVLLKKNGCSW